MKLRIVAIGLCFFCFNACEKDGFSDPKPISTSINKILPLGASRVEGGRPAYESFRYELWKLLKEDQITFDFVGTQSDEAIYPSFNGDEFDIDHEGRGGWTSGEIRDGLEDWLIEVGTADIVLLSSPGGNDALLNLSYREAVDNINAIIDILQDNNSNVTIIIEQLAPARSEDMTAELTSFITKIHQDVLNIAASKTTATSQVIPIDMFTGFEDRFLADDVHYNEEGAMFVANRYYDVLLNVLE